MPFHLPCGCQHNVALALHICQVVIVGTETCCLRRINRPLAPIHARCRARRFYSKWVLRFYSKWDDRGDFTQNGAGDFTQNWTRRGDFTQNGVGIAGNIFLLPSHPAVYQFANPKGFPGTASTVWLS